ncbi:hypothetical protein RCL1_004224 [Eukaryota sp. TZLM3-RCL]
MDNSYLSALSNQLLLLGFPTDLVVDVDSESLSCTIKSLLPENDTVASSALIVVRLISSPLVLGRYYTCFSALISKSPIWERLFASVVKLSVTFTSEEPSFRIHSGPAGIELIDSVQLNSELVPQVASAIAPIRSLLPAAAIDFAKTSFARSFEGLSLNLDLSKCPDLETPANAALVACSVLQACDSVITTINSSLATSKVSVVDRVIVSKSNSKVISGITITPLSNDSKDGDDVWSFSFTRDHLEPSTMVLAQAKEVSVLVINPKLVENVFDSPLYSPPCLSLKFLIGEYFDISKDLVSFELDSVVKTTKSQVNSILAPLETLTNEINMSIDDSFSVLQGFMTVSIISSLPELFSRVPPLIAADLFRLLTLIEFNFTTDVLDEPVSLCVEKIYCAKSNKKVTRSLIIRVGIPQNSSLFPGLCCSKKFKDFMLHQLICESKHSFILFYNDLLIDLLRLRTELRTYLGSSCNLLISGRDVLISSVDPSDSLLNSPGVLNSPVKVSNDEKDDPRYVLSSLFGVVAHNPRNIYDLLQNFCLNFAIDQSQDNCSPLDKFALVFQSLFDGITDFYESDNSSLIIKSISISADVTARVFFDRTSSTLFFNWSIDPNTLSLSFPSESDVSLVLRQCSRLPLVPAIDSTSKNQALKELLSSNCHVADHLDYLLELEMFRVAPVDAFSQCFAHLPVSQAEISRHYMTSLAHSNTPVLILLTNSKSIVYQGLFFFLVSSCSITTSIRPFYNGNMYKFFSFSEIDTITTGLLGKQSLSSISIHFKSDMSEDHNDEAHSIVLSSTYSGTSAAAQRQATATANEFAYLACILAKSSGNIITPNFGGVLKQPKKCLLSL